MAAGGVLVGRGYVSIRPEFEGNWTRDASSRGGDAGKGAGAAFGKAFSAGLKGIGQLAGVAIASNIATIAPAAAAIAPAMATAGAAVGALKIGLSGVGDAFKAAFADSSADAAKAAAATHAVESAQRSLANAQRGLADARRQAAQQVQDAEDGVTSAERDLADAQKASLAAQRGLTSARQDAVRSLEDMNNQLADAQLSQRSAVLQLKDAQDALTKAQNNKSTTPEQLAQAQLAYDQAAQNLKEQRLDVQRLQHDTAAANKAGIEGSQQVADAKAKVASADQDVQDKEAALAKAQAGVDKARADGQRQIQDAQRGVAEAASALAEAQAAAASQTSALDQAMAKLAPNAQSFVRSIQGLAPAWDRMRLSVQNRLFAGLGTSVTSLANTALPVLQTRLTETAGIWNTIGQNAVTAAKRMATSGTLDTILKGANANLAIFEKVPGQVVTAFGQLAVAAQPGLNKLLTQAGGAINAFAGGLSKAFASGGLQDAIGAAFGLVSQLGTALGNVLGIVISVLKTAQASGGQILGVLGAVLGELNKIFASKSVQDALRSLFSSVAQIIGAIVPAIGAVVQAAVPLIAAIGPAIATVAKALGPVLSQLATALGVALLPIITALMPVVQQVGLAIVGIVRAVIPLLKPIGTLIASIVNALAPALTPIIGVIMQLVTVLVGPLTAIIKALTPAFALIGKVISQAFTALTPILTPIVNLIGQAAKLIAGIFATALTALLTAIQPLIPVGIQLVKSVLGALAPILPVLGTALSTLAGALLTLLKPLTQVWISLYKQLAPVFGVLAPVIGQLAGLIATTLAGVLPPLTQAFLILVRAVVPIVPLIGQVLGVVLNLGANLLKQLLPSLVQLISASLQLIVALTPILPPLAQVVALVLKLAGGVLATLLPPLITLANFLVGNFALGLATIIGWLSSFVRWLTKITGPAVKQIADTISTQVGIAVAVFKGLFDFVVGKVLPAIVGFIRGPLASAFRWAYDTIIKPIWNGVSSTIGSVWKFGIKPTFEAVKDAVGKVGKAFGTARDAIGKSWSQIQDVTKKPVNFVISSVYTHGIKAVWDRIASFVHLPKLPTAPKLLAAGGTVGAGWGPATPGIYNRPTAIVGEGRSQYPEYVIPTDPRYRARALALHQAAGTRLMASGGILGRLDDVLSGAAHGLSDATGKVWSGIKTAADITSHPEKAWGTVTAPVRKAILSLGSSPMARLVEAVPLKALDGLKETLLTAVGLGGGSRFVSTRIPSGQHRTVISQALAAAGVPPPGTMTQWLSGMNTLITRESGWNPRAINSWDSNAKAGHPSQGLTQTIPGTWAHYVPTALRSRGILDPVGNVAASIRYIVSRYGNITRVQQANASLPPKGYDSGGWLQPGYTMTYNGTGKPEAVFTHAQFTALMSGQAGGSRGDLIYNAAVREVASRQSVLDALATYDALHRPTVTGV